MTTRLQRELSGEESAGPEASVPFDERKMITVDDESLLRSTFLKDPEEGCALLFRRYYVNLCNHTIRFVHSRDVAEDIVSELFAHFWQNRVFEQVSSSYRAYLYKSARHRAYNYLRWQVHTSDSLDSISMTTASDSVSPDDALLYTELHVKVERIIQQLPPQCQRAYLLKRVEGKKYEEIASELQISVKGVEALVSRALLRLRNDLRDNWFLCIMFFQAL